VDLEAGTMRYSAAGHPPLLWWSRNGHSVQAVEENGMVLGFMPRAAYTSVERPIQNGDRFVLYTDGLLEATDGTEEYYGDVRLREAIAAAKILNAEKSTEALLDGLAQWTRNRPQEDDLTIVVIDIHEAALPREILN
jgi:phosphoserine phosphatase RsbU/P